MAKFNALPFRETGRRFDSVFVYIYLAQATTGVTDT